MEEKNEMDKLVEDVMLPGFRFHPTDEELIGFYLKRKIQNRPLYIELIKQVDIYKYDPWDLPKLGSTGEKEWYFYCPRDRKYRNSTRPNRVTGAGFWKATGTDRPIYSSHGNKCIGLKKSLVFYRGRAAKGFKTDWMMHEFRLPSSISLDTTQQQPKKKLFDKTLPPNDSWAICRIFKKANSMAQRAFSHSWVSGFPDITASDSDILTQGQELGGQFTQFSTEIEPVIQFCTTSHLQQQTSTTSFNNKPYNFPFPNGEILNNGFEISRTTNPTIVDATSMLFNPEFQSPEQQFGGFSISLSQDIVSIEEDEAAGFKKKNPGASEEDSNQWREIEFPFSLPDNIDAWKPTLPWDSPPCSSEMSTSFT